MVGNRRSQEARRNRWAQIGISASALVLPPIVLGAAVFSMLPGGHSAQPPTSTVASATAAVMPLPAIKDAARPVDNFMSAAPTGPAAASKINESIAPAKPAQLAKAPQPVAPHAAVSPAASSVVPNETVASVKKTTEPPANRDPSNYSLASAREGTAVKDNESSTNEQKTAAVDLDAAVKEQKHTAKERWPSIEKSDEPTFARSAKPTAKSKEDTAREKDTSREKDTARERDTSREKDSTREKDTGREKDIAREKDKEKDRKSAGKNGQQKTATTKDEQSNAKTPEAIAAVAPQESKPAVESTEPTSKDQDTVLAIPLEHTSPTENPKRATRGEEPAAKKPTGKDPRDQDVATTVRAPGGKDQESITKREELAAKGNEPEVNDRTSVDARSRAVTEDPYLAKDRETAVEKSDSTAPANHTQKSTTKTRDEADRGKKSASKSAQSKTATSHNEKPDEKRPDSVASSQEAVAEDGKPIAKAEAPAVAPMVVDQHAGANEQEAVAKRVDMAADNHELARKGQTSIALNPQTTADDQKFVQDPGSETSEKTDSVGSIVREEKSPTKKEAAKNKDENDRGKKSASKSQQAKALASQSEKTKKAEPIATNETPPTDDDKPIVKAAEAVAPDQRAVGGEPDLKPAKSQETATAKKDEGSRSQKSVTKNKAEAAKNEAAKDEARKNKEDTAAAKKSAGKNPKAPIASNDPVITSEKPIAEEPAVAALSPEQQQPAPLPVPVTAAPQAIVSPADQQAPVSGAPLAKAPEPAAHTASPEVKDQAAFTADPHPAEKDQQAIVMGPEISASDAVVIRQPRKDAAETRTGVTENRMVIAKLQEPAIAQQTKTDSLAAAPQPNLTVVSKAPGLSAEGGGKTGRDRPSATKDQERFGSAQPRSAKDQEPFSNQEPFSSDERPAPLAKDEEHAALDQEPVDEERNPSGKGLARDMGPIPVRVTVVTAPLRAAADGAAPPLPAPPLPVPAPREAMRTDVAVPESDVTETKEQATPHATLKRHFPVTPSRKFTQKRNYGRNGSRWAGGSKRQ
jgi:hypothetical protein